MDTRATIWLMKAIEKEIMGMVPPIIHYIVSDLNVAYRSLTPGKAIRDMNEALLQAASKPVALPDYTFAEAAQGMALFAQALIGYKAEPYHPQPQYEVMLLNAGYAAEIRCEVK